MTPIRLRISIITAGLALLLLFAIGCGGDEDCNSDHDCDDVYVCEPSGCELTCTTDEDCPAADECTTRRVENGSACTPKSN